MRYELYLRAIEPGAGSAKALMAALEQEPTTRRQQLQFSVDESDVRGALYPADPAFWEAPQDGVSFGLDLEIPGEASEQVSAALCEVAFRWAEQWALSVYDPQLGRTVTKRDREVICARIKRQADYLAEVVGIGDRRDARLIDVALPPRRMRWRTKFYLGLAGLLVVLAILTQFC